MRVERFHDILRQQTMIDTGVFVLLKLRQFILPNVDHGCRLYELRGVIL